MKFDKAKAENVLLGVLYDKDNLQQTEDMLLDQLYNRMTDAHIDITMPRLLKAIAAAINKGYVEWGSLGFSSDDISLDLATVFRLTDKGIMKAQELAEEGQPHLSNKTQEKAEESEEPEHAWDDEFAEYDDEADDEDEFAKEDYEDDAPEDYKDSEDYEDSEDSEDSEDEAEGESATQGINSDKSTDALGSITPRTVAINKDEAYWVDTHDELTPEEYKDILGVSREEFKGSFNEAVDKAIDNAIEYHENWGIEDEEEYPEDEDEDESTDDDDNCAQFCHICGTIADLQDNFCCVCGHRLFPGLQDPIIVKVIPTRKTSKGKADARDAADAAARQRQRQQDKLDNIDILYNMFEKLGIF